AGTTDFLLDLGTRHRLKPRPPVAERPPPAETMIKADIGLLVPEMNCFSDNDNDGITLLTYF
ncbi:hypothetical protein, partial [uncultured Lamprocystis sp.]|uniref:hypothetical protein n=1 Tax=uncultured Lamprocystis sp. TaxID=543132 RepID=UPI0026013666